MDERTAVNNAVHLMKQALRSVLVKGPRLSSAGNNRFSDVRHIMVPLDGLP